MYVLTLNAVGCIGVVTVTVTGSFSSVVMYRGGSVAAVEA